MDSATSVTPEERRRTLEQIGAEVAVCERCPLHTSRTLAVPGEGHPDTEVVFIGEGPGYNEDQQGRPFVGAAGNLLNDLLRQIGWKRQEVFITNVVKCRPPQNRDPEPAEIAACAPFLKRQLEVLDPAVVVTLGRHSLGYFNPGERISGAHGTVRPTDPETGARDSVTFAMYHPAAALRQGALKQTMLEDMCKLPDALIESRKRRSMQPELTHATEVAQPADFTHEPLEELTPEPEPATEVYAESQPDSRAYSDDTGTVALAVEPELVAVAVNGEQLSEIEEALLIEQVVVDENQMSLF